MFRQAMKELRVSIVTQVIFARCGSRANIEIVVRERHFAGAEVGEETAIAVNVTLKLASNIFSVSGVGVRNVRIFSGPIFGIRGKKKAKTFSPKFGRR